jgi:methyl-accepting chemotaxis protein WspA
MMNNFFKNLNLQGRMIAAFFFMGAIVLIVALVGMSGNLRLTSHINTLENNSLPSIIGLWKINEGQTQIESSERALLDPRLSQKDRENELKRISQAWKQIDDGFKQYKKTPRTDEEERIYQQLETNWNIWKKNHEQFLEINQEFEKLRILNPIERQLELSRKNQRNSPAMAAAVNASNIFNKLNERAQANRLSFIEATKSIEENLKINEDIAEKAETAATQDVTQSRFWMIIGIILGPLTAIIFGYYFSNSIAKPLGTRIASIVEVAHKMSIGDLTVEVPLTDQQDDIAKLQTSFHSMNRGLNTLIKQVQKSGVQISTSATKIAASGKQLEATVNEQAASTNEVVATAKEIATTSRQLVKTMDEVSHMSEATTKEASGGQKELSRMEKTMGQLAGATSSISGKLGIISEKANNINSIITTITKVADQTNLLSLNAAIEAEKAGEYGMGFAVVAREIRRLADQTAVATLDIENMVKEMQSAVSTGVMEMDKFSKEVSRGIEDIRNISYQLAQIIQQVQSLTPRFDAVNRGMDAQSDGAQQISEAMLQLSEASIQTAEALREINGSISQLNEASQGLRQQISSFKIN